MSADRSLAVSTRWLVYRTAHARFPFRVVLERDGRVLLAVRAAAAWPGPGQQVFCLREDGLDPAEPVELVDEAPVLSTSRIGRKLAVALDRPVRKRCEFLFLTKPYLDRPGTYEQVFFRTESGIRSHRSRSRLEVRERDVEVHVVIDSAERYPWRFPGATVMRRKLPVGDYALMDGDTTAAVVERKSFDNLMGDLGAMQALHHSLAHLRRVRHAALVVEAQYADFLDEKRLVGRWPAAFVARALAEVSAMHPGLPIVFAGNRALANQWTHRFFLACAQREEAPQLEFVREGPDADGSWSHGPPLDERIREAVQEAGTNEFTAAAIVATVEGATSQRVRRVLHELRSEGIVRSIGRGRGTRWMRT